MELWTNLLFYAVFIGQIFVLSWYYPEKLLARMAYVQKTFPPSEYPRLYPRPFEHYQQGMWAFRLLSRGTLVLGVVILLAVMFLVDHQSFADDGYISEFWPMVYAVFQFIPILILEFSEYGHAKQMRAANQSPVRRAELKPRSISDFVPRWLVLLAGSLVVVAIAVDLMLHDFVLSSDNGVIARSLTLLATNAFFVAVSLAQMMGKKHDPLQTATDRSRVIAAHIGSAAYVSLMVSAFMMLNAVDQVYAIDYLDATVLSLYIQGTAILSVGHMLRSIRLKDVNFDVYRDPANRPAPTATHS